MSEWQTIETCPDSGMIWVHGGKFKEPAITEADGNWWRQRKGWAWVPTHWMPFVLPEPPK